VFLAQLAEIDSSKCYVPEGFESMQRYCEDAFGMTEDRASRMIRAARVAHEHRSLFPALADGRLSWSGVVILAPHLTTDNVQELIEAATRKTNQQIRDLLVARTPKLDFSVPATEFVPELSRLSALVRIEETAPPPVTSASAAPPPPPTLARRAVILTLDEELNSLLSRAIELLGYKLRSGEPREVFRRSLRHFVSHLERTAINEPRPSLQTQDANSRYIPTRVRAGVWKRDRARCTFVSESGHRCTATKDLEFDHVVPFALGGATSAGNLRLRCRAHNQYAAECVFGREFMDVKRRAAWGSSA